MKRRANRRRKRSQDVLRALSYQLDACREEADLEAMVVSDEYGMCVAAAGQTETCEEIAARLPILGRRAANFDGVLLSGRGGWQVKVRTFEVGGSSLYACAVGGRDEDRELERPLERSIAGATRILAA